MYFQPKRCHNDIPETDRGYQLYMIEVVVKLQGSTFIFVAAHHLVLPGCNRQEVKLWAANCFAKCRQAPLLFGAQNIHSTSFRNWLFPGDSVPVPTTKTWAVIYNIRNVDHTKDMRANIYRHGEQTCWPHNAYIMQSHLYLLLRSKRVDHTTPSRGQSFHDYLQSKRDHNSCKTCGVSLYLYLQSKMCWLHTVKHTWQSKFILTFAGATCWTNTPQEKCGSHYLWLSLVSKRMTTHRKSHAAVYV